MVVSAYVIRVNVFGRERVGLIVFEGDMVGNGVGFLVGALVGAAVGFLVGEGVTTAGFAVCTGDGGKP